MKLSFLAAAERDVLLSEQCTQLAEQYGAERNITAGTRVVSAVRCVVDGHSRADRAVLKLKYREQIFGMSVALAPHVGHSYEQRYPSDGLSCSDTPCGGRLSDRILAASRSIVIISCCIRAVPCGIRILS